MGKICKLLSQKKRNATNCPIKRQTRDPHFSMLMYERNQGVTLACVCARARVCACVCVHSGKEIKKIRAVRHLLIKDLRIDLCAMQNGARVRRLINDSRERGKRNCFPRSRNSVSGKSALPIAAGKTRKRSQLPVGKRISRVHLELRLPDKLSRTVPLAVGFVAPRICLRE